MKFRGRCVLTCGPSGEGRDVAIVDGLPCRYLHAIHRLALAGHSQRCKRIDKYSAISHYGWSSRCLHIAEIDCMRGTTRQYRCMLSIELVRGIGRTAPEADVHTSTFTWRLCPRSLCVAPKLAFPGAHQRHAFSSVTHSPV